jgi:hypothetical protein
MGFGASFHRWSVGARPEPVPLPGRPPAERSSRVEATSPPRRLRAVCCSGGGIRSAAFSLGGIQGLQERDGDGKSWYDGVDLITAVSGGSYLAGSLAMVNHELSDEERQQLPPYASGSPEDNRLRNHTRYLVEDPRVAAVGVLSILHGLLLNLLPILAGIYVTAKLLGWTLLTTGVLTHTASSWQTPHVAAVAVVVAAIALLGVMLFAMERLHDVYRPPRETLRRVVRAWSIRLLQLAAAVAFLFLVVPFLLHLLSTSRFDVDVAGASATSQWSAFVVTATALVGLVKGTLGRFKGTLQTSAAGKPSAVATWAGRLLRAAAPWIGSAVAVLLLLAAFLVWTASAAYDGLQALEVGLIALAVVGIVAWQAFTDINRNSVHPFYKERLSTAYAVRRKKAAPGAEEIPFDTAIRFSTYAGDRPELVVCAAVNTDEEGVVPSGRGCAPFTFGPRHTGISSGTMFGGEAPRADRLMRPTEEYEEAAGPRLVTLPGAVAVSGAAVSPVMGRMTRKPLRLLLGLANVRLGLWLPNPLRPELPPAPARDAPFRQIVSWQLRQPGIKHLLREILGSVSLNGRWIYVTDGGHYENLGLVEALRRGATEIVVFDASGDPPDSWVTFGEAVQTARADLGVEIYLDPSEMRPTTDTGRAPALVVPGYCRYPNGARAELWFCKLALPEEAPASWDVYAWKVGHRDFPNDSTAQQLYGDRQFEAYRRLGELAALTALDVMRQPSASVVAADRPEETDRIDEILPVAGHGIGALPGPGVVGQRG